MAQSHCCPPAARVPTSCGPYTPRPFAASGFLCVDRLTPHLEWSQLDRAYVGKETQAQTYAYVCRHMLLIYMYMSVHIDTHIDI